MSPLTQLPHVKNVILDMNGTFMFNHDRLGVDENYYSTYQQLGGVDLKANRVQRLVNETVNVLHNYYQSNLYQDAFPSVMDVLNDVCGNDVPKQDVLLLEQVISVHEMGEVNTKHRDTLISLAGGYSLYVLSNLWSNSEPWQKYLHENVGDEVFSGWLFSSDIGVNKPSFRIFNQLLAPMKVAPAEVVLIGDDLGRDIVPAHNLGMTTIWIASQHSKAPEAHFVIEDLSELVLA